MKQLTQEQFEFFSCLHERCWNSGDLLEDRVKIFDLKIRKYEQEDYNMDYFRRMADTYYDVLDLMRRR